VVLDQTRTQSSARRRLHRGETVMTDFIEELLAESAIADANKRIEVNKLRADQLLMAVSTLDTQMAEVNELADDEIQLIEAYRSKELARLDKKRSWLLWNLEQFMRSTSEKTIRLPHGTLKIRKGRDRVAIVAMEKFLAVANKLKLLRKVPEEYNPDNAAILAHVKNTGEIPPGVEFIPAGSKFSYSTNGESDDTDEREQAEG
jgi:hypothetical protein